MAVGMVTGYLARFRARRGVACGLLVLTASLLISPPSWAFECRAPPAVARPGALKETPARTRMLARFLRRDDPGNSAPLIVAVLRGRYPDVADAEVLDYLMTAYCPVVARLSGLGEAAKRTRMRLFASQLKAAIDTVEAPKPAPGFGWSPLEHQTSGDTRPPRRGRASGEFPGDTYRGGWDDTDVATGSVVAI
jgi:hypothetical protein